MTIKEIKADKKRLESDIFTLIRKFEERSGTTINSLELHSMFCSDWIHKVKICVKNPLR